MSNNKTPRSRHGRKDWSPRKIEEKSLSDSKASSSRWDTNSSLSTPCTGEVRPSSWDNSDDEEEIISLEVERQYFPVGTRIFSNYCENSENEIKEAKSQFQENEKTVYTALLEDIKIIDLDRRQSPARVRRRSKSSGSSSPVLEGKSENFSEKEGNLSSEDSDIVSPKLNYLDFNNILLDLQAEQSNLEESKSADHKKQNLDPLIHELGSRYCRTSRKLSKILEVEEMRKENEEKPQTPKTEAKNNLNVTINSVLLHQRSLKDKFELSMLPPNDKTLTENISQKQTSSGSHLKRISLNKCLSVEKLVPNNNLLDFKRGSLSDRCQFLKCNDNDNVIFLTAKTGKTEIGFTKDPSWVDWSNQISSATVLPASEEKTNELEMFKESEGVKNLLKIDIEKNSQTLNQHPQLFTKNSSQSINLSERTLTEDVLYLDSPKFQINIDSARSMEVEDLRTPNSDQQEAQKIIKTKKSTCENSFLVDTYRKNKNFDVKKEYSKRLKNISKSCGEREANNSLDGNLTNINQGKKKIEEPSRSENSSILSETEIHNKSKENLFTWGKLSEMTTFQEHQDEFNTSRTFHVGQETGSEGRESELEWDKGENLNLSNSSRTQASIISENIQLFQNNCCLLTNRSSNTTSISKNHFKISKDSVALNSNNSSSKDKSATEEKKQVCSSSRGLNKSNKWKELIEMQNVSGEFEVEKTEQKTVSSETENTLEDFETTAQTNFTIDTSKYNSLSSKIGNQLKRINKRDLSEKHQIIGQKESTQLNQSKMEKQTEEIDSDTSNAFKIRYYGLKEVEDKVPVNEMSLNLIENPVKKHQGVKTHDNLSQPPGSNSEGEKKLNTTINKSDSQEFYQKQRLLDPDIYLRSLSITDRTDYNSEKSFGRVTFDDIIKNFEFKSSEALTKEDQNDCKIQSETDTSENWSEKNKENKSIRQGSIDIFSLSKKNERKPENTCGTIPSEALNEKPTHDTATWNDLIETFNKSQKYPAVNNFPGFPGGSQTYDSQLQEVFEDQSGSEETTAGTETQRTLRLQQVKDNDSFPYFSSSLKNCLNEQDTKKKKNFVECRSQTFFFDLEKREPFGVGECGDATFWNFGNLKQTDSEKPKDHGDGNRTFEKWGETNLTSKKCKETKNQRQLWTELRDESFTKSSSGSTLFAQENNTQEGAEFGKKMVKKSLSDEILDKVSTVENQIQKFGKSRTENIKFLVNQRKISIGKNKYETQSTSEVYLVNSDLEEERKLSNLETVRRLSCSAFTINTNGLQNENENLTNLSNNSEMLSSKNFFKSTENLKRFEMFLIKRDKTKKYEKQNNWLTVHHSSKKKKFKKISNPKQEKGFLLSPSTESERKTTPAPPTLPILRLRKTNCLRSICKRVVSVFCLTSDSSAATSK